jgi:exodeoxyribonuclease VII small subunit
VSDDKKAAPEKYDELMQRLSGVVEQLETGELSLEDSLKQFEEGVRLVRKGEELLDQAEHRIEQLLSEGGKDKAVPLDPQSARGAKAEKPKAAAKAPPADDDVPF